MAPLLDGHRAWLFQKMATPTKRRIVLRWLLTALWLSLPVAQADPAAPILLGMSTALSGPAAELGRNMLLGVETGFDRVNRHGGIQGRELQVIALDDGYEPARTAPNMRQLITTQKVLAVIGNVGTPTAIAAIPIANQEHTLLFAPFTGAGVLRKQPPDSYIINFRASYAEETAAMVDALIDTGGLKPEEVGFFTQRDGYGDAGFAGGIKALKRHGLRNGQAVAHGRYERNTLSVENGLADILLHQPVPRAIIMVGAYAPCARFIQLARENGLDALFLNVSFVGSTPLAAALTDQHDRVIVTQVVPHPQNVSVPLVAEYQADLQDHAPNARPSFVGLEGYIAARIFTRALSTLQVAPDRKNIIDALQGLGDFDIGLGIDLYLSGKHHQASHNIWPTVLKEGHFVPMDWSDIGSMLK